MLDQLKDLHRRLGQALELLEPLQGLLEALRSAPEPPRPPDGPPPLARVLEPPAQPGAVPCARPGCDHRFSPRAGAGGAAQRYCSAACRKRAGIVRQRAAPPPEADLEPLPDLPAGKGSYRPDISRSRRHDCRGTATGRRDSVSPAAPPWPLIRDRHRGQLPAFLLALIESAPQILDHRVLVGEPVTQLP